MKRELPKYPWRIGLFLPNFEKSNIFNQILNLKSRPISRIADDLEYILSLYWPEILAKRFSNVRHQVLTSEGLEVLENLQP